MIRSSSTRISCCTDVFSLLCCTQVVLCCFTIPGRCDSGLPQITTKYYTAVSGGFGKWPFSFNYHEYASPSQWQAVSRYYAPDTQEWIDLTESPQTYSIQIQTPPNKGCVKYLGLDVVSTLLWKSTGAFFDSLRTESKAMFASNPVTTLRSQLQFAVPFTATITYQDTDPVPSVDEFLNQAYQTVHLSISPPYNVSVVVTVYFASDQYGNLTMTGDGNTPLRFTIIGTRSDNVNKNSELNIVYDFMNWAQLDENAITAKLPTPDNCIPQTQPPPLPTIPQLSQPINSPTRPSWGGGRAIMELTTTIPAPNLEHVEHLVYLTKTNFPAGCIGQEMVAYLMSATDYDWNTDLYLYAQGVVNKNFFNSGPVYTILHDNIIPDPDLYRYPSAASATPSCSGVNINSGNTSPVQWLLNGGNLMRIFNDDSFLAGAQNMGQTDIGRGILADKWSIDKVNITNTNLTNISYTFTLNMFIMPEGWLNIGRTLSAVSTLPRQLLRLDYAGTMVGPGMPNPVSYDLRMDFFTQHDTPYLVDPVGTFNRSNYGCPVVKGTAHKFSSESVPVKILDVDNGSAIQFIGGIFVSLAVAFGVRKYFGGVKEKTKVQ